MTVDTVLRQPAMNTRQPAWANPHYDKVPAGWFSDDRIGRAPTREAKTPAAIAHQHR